MKILVTFAVDAEFAPWRRLRKFQESTLGAEHSSGGVPVATTRIGDHGVYIFLTGIGSKLLGFAAAKCFRQAGVEVVISSGLAGSLKGSYPALTIICPSRVAALKEATGMAVTRAVFEMAVRSKATAIDTLLTSSHIIDSREEKARLAVLADAVDMESRHIVASFLEQQIPVGVIRAISDGSEEDLPIDFENCLTSSGKVKSIPLLRELARKPAKVPELIRFGRQSRAAAERLVRFLDSFIQELKPELLFSEIEKKEAR